MNKKNEKGKEEKKEVEIIPAKEPDQLTIEVFGTGNPQVMIRKAKAIADSVADIIRTRKLFTTIRGKAYVWCEGWTTMGALLGIFPHIIEVEDLSNWENNIKRYRAICEVRLLNGTIVARAESECSNEEGTKGKNKYGSDNKGKSEWEDYAVRSMAETRAISKTLRIALGWIMKLAGYEPTPAEEIDKDMVEETDTNGNGEVDIKTEEIEMAIPKNDGEGNKGYIIRQIEFIMNKLKMGQDEFKKKVKDIDSFGNQTLTELGEIRNVLWIKHKFGKAIKKIK